VIVGLLVGGTAGSIMAKRVEMTKMPELVAFMHSMIGLAAVFIAIAAVVEPQSLGIVKHLGDSIPPVTAWSCSSAPPSVPSPSPVR
jgi:NAD(P) transhydrogenase subunit beta